MDMNNLLVIERLGSSRGRCEILKKLEQANDKGELKSFLDIANFITTNRSLMWPILDELKKEVEK